MSDQNFVSNNVVIHRSLIQGNATCRRILQFIYARNTSFDLEFLTLSLARALPIMWRERNKAQNFVNFYSNVSWRTDSGDYRNSYILMFKTKFIECRSDLSQGEILRHGLCLVHKAVPKTYSRPRIGTPDIVLGEYINLKGHELGT